MIVRDFELKKKFNDNINFYLLYGVNFGLIEETIENIFKKFSENVFNYQEDEILSNSEEFLEKIFNKSFFEKNKLIIINNASDKILDTIKEIIEKKFNDLKIVIKSGTLGKKSKLRNLFEKNDNVVCVPFYEDTNQSLSTIAYAYCSSKKIKISKEIINIIVGRAKGDRISLKNELEKINNLNLTKKQITNIDVMKLTNLSEDYSIAELVDCSLLKNKFKLIKILNENNFAIEDCVIILRAFMFKLKRLKKIKKEIDKNNMNIDDAVASFKPQIFWKEKEIVKEQLRKFSYKNIKDLILKANKIEFLSKKNPQLSINLTTNFVINNLND